MSAKRKPEKNLSLYGIRTLDFCDTGAAAFFRNCISSVYNFDDLPSNRTYTNLIQKFDRLLTESLIHRPILLAIRLSLKIRIVLIPASTTVTCDQAFFLFFFFFKGGRGEREKKYLRDIKG